MVRDDVIIVIVHVVVYMGAIDVMFARGVIDVRGC